MALSKLARAVCRCCPRLSRSPESRSRATGGGEGEGEARDCTAACCTALIVPLPLVLGLVVGCDTGTLIPAGRSIKGHNHIFAFS